MSDIPISKIDQSFPNDSSKLNWYIIFITGYKLTTFMTSNWQLTTTLRGFINVGVGYRTKIYSDIQYNVGLCALQSDIGRSDIRLSPISLITDIGLSAHLWIRETYFF
jgi:hypothetical protein